MNPSGASVLLTGATGGLGRAVAAAFAARGSTLILSGRNPEALAEMARGLEGSGHRTAPADLAEAGAAEALAAQVGEVEILVANAGLPGVGRLEELSAEQVTRALRVNLEAPMLLARALYPAMVERRAGHLVFVSSLAGKAASPRSSVYNATKFGLRGFALGLRGDLNPAGVGVSLVSPGFIREAGMFADAGTPTPPGLGTATPQRVGEAVLGAIERDRVEVTVAPLRQRALAHVALSAPSVSARISNGSAAQKAADRVAAGHPPEKR